MLLSNASGSMIEQDEELFHEFGAATMRELVGPTQALNTTRTRYQIMSPTITL